MIKLRVLVASLVLGAAGCNMGSLPPKPPQLPTAHLYTVGPMGSVSVIREWQLPGTTLPASFNFDCPTEAAVIATAVDPGGRVAVGNTAGRIEVYAASLAATSTPTATFQNGTASTVGQMTFNTFGALVVATSGFSINLFAPPFSNATTPAQTLTNGNFIMATGVAVDSSANLYVTNATIPGTIFADVIMLASPYTGAATVAQPQANVIYGAAAIVGTQLLVLAKTTLGSQVDVYNIPLTAGAPPAFSFAAITTPTFYASITSDPSGRVYIGDPGAGGVDIYNPPYSASSVQAQFLNTQASLPALATGP